MPKQPIRLALLCMVATFTYCASAQSVIVPGYINLPKDTVVKNELITSLNGFLAQKEKPNKENTFVLKANLLETSDLLDEMKGMEQNAQAKDNNFYKCYLSNVIKVDDNNFMVQFSYIGVNMGNPILRASFRLLAKRDGEVFYFYSPLKQNTIAWKVKKYGNLTCYYKDTLNAAAAKDYRRMVNFYDAKLKAPDYPIDFYYADNFNEVQQLLGIDYKADYNGSKYNNLTAHEDNRILMVSGWNDETHRFDAHDFWHERLRMVMSPTVINRPVDEGCAYLYGGSWGYTWEEVQLRFKKYVADNPNADWLNLYLSTANFEGGEKPLKAGYVLNALIVQKIEREKGFAAVLQLLSCGPRQKGDDNYFAALEKISGISKADFNVKMWELIKEMK